MGGGIVLRLLMCSTLIQISIVVAGSNLRKQGIREGIRPVRHLVSKSSSDKSNRRTFVTALLAAEVAYLESLLAKQNSKKGRPKKPKSLPPTRHVNNQIRVPQPKQQQHKQKKNPAIKEEFVSKPDPFYMIDAPDLSVKPSKSSESLSKVYVVSTSSSPPPPAIYSSPSTTSTSPPPKQSTKAPHTRKPGTTLKYGDFELYHPRGYLPPPAPKRKAPQEQKKKTASASYFKIKPATYHSVPSPPPPPSKSVQYKPKPLKTTKKPLPEPSSVTYSPSKGYLPPHGSKVTAPKNSYQVIKSTDENKSNPLLLEEEEEKKVSIVPPRPKTTSKGNSNLHPHTFFNDDQAKKVHKGDWPPIYYNSLHKDHNKKQ